MKKIEDMPTQRPCPACARCAWCNGTREIQCYRCEKAHRMECPACSTCGLCQGTHLVSDDVRERWLNERPTDPPTGAA